MTYGTKATSDTVVVLSEYREYLEEHMVEFLKEHMHDCVNEVEAHMIMKKMMHSVHLLDELIKERS